jgi:hypothetical protein
MKYSTDPSDFTSEIDTDYKTSTSERKSSRGGIYSVTTIEKFQDDGKSTTKSVTSSPSSKIIRRGSVDYHDCEGECETYKVSKGYKTTSKDSKSFLNSEKKASNVQEVLSYMKNADNGEFACT